MNKVFEKTFIGAMQLKNRIIRSATHEGMSDKNGHPTKDLVEIYLGLAKGGAGAIITGYTAIQQNGKTLPNMRMFDNDRYIADYRLINSKIKKYETPVILQLAHGGSRTSSLITGEDVVGPSSKENGNQRICRELSESEIKQIIKNFIRAIQRAKQAEFDGVQLHAAHGYLLSEFLSPRSNKRADKWGKITKNRFRILAEIIQGAKDKVGNYPILVKISAYDDWPGGMRIKEAVKIAQLLQNVGCDAIEVSCGPGVKNSFYSVRVRQIPKKFLFRFPGFKKNLLPSDEKITLKPSFNCKEYRPLHNYNVSVAETIKRHVNIPVIVVGGIRKIKDIANIIEKGKADFVSMCRPFIIEPDIVNKFFFGIQNKSRCLDCGYCLLGISSNRLKCYFGKSI